MNKVHRKPENCGAKRVTGHGVNSNYKNNSLSKQKFRLPGCSEGTFIFHIYNNKNRLKLFKAPVKKVYVAYHKSGRNSAATELEHKILAMPEEGENHGY